MGTTMPTDKLHSGSEPRFIPPRKLPPIYGLRPLLCIKLKTIQRAAGQAVYGYLKDPVGAEARERKPGSPWGGESCQAEFSSFEVDQDSGDSAQASVVVANESLLAPVS